MCGYSSSKFDENSIRDLVKQKTKNPKKKIGKKKLKFEEGVYIYRKEAKVGVSERVKL